MLATLPVRSGRFLINHSMRRRKPGRCSSISGSRVSTAKSGIKPDHRAHAHGDVLRRRACAARRNRSRPLRPTARRCRRPMLFIACGDVDESAPRTCWPHLRKPGPRAPAPEQSPAGSSVYIAIQLVPSDCSMKLPVGKRRSCGRRRRCCPGPESRPRKMLLPSTSLRLTHQVKLSSSLWKTLSRKMRSPRRRAASLRSCRRATPPRHERAGSRRRTPTRKRGAARSGACTIRAASGRAALWRSPDRRARAARSGRPGPRPHTRDTPTCRAWR